MEILSELTSLSPKVVKVSVMAHTEQDVLDLMNYTRGFKTLNPEQEYVTISMGKMGKVSRITSERYIGELGYPIRSHHGISLAQVAPLSLIRLLREVGRGLYNSVVS